MNDMLKDMVDNARVESEIEIKDIDIHIKTLKTILTTLIVMLVSALAGAVVFDTNWLYMISAAISIFFPFVYTNYLSLRGRRRVLTKKT